MPRFPHKAPAAVCLAALAVALFVPHAAALELYGETQVELEWHEGGWAWIAREVAEISFDPTSVWVVIDAKVPLFSGPKTFGYQLALSRRIGDKHLTLSWRQTLGESGWFFIQFSFPW